MTKKSTKKRKLNSKETGKAGVVQYPSRDIYTEFNIFKEFKSMDEVEALKRKVITLGRKFCSTYPNISKEMEPIFIFSPLSIEGIERTKRNLLKAEIIWYLSTPIYKIDEIDFESIEKLFEDISN